MKSVLDALQEGRLIELIDEDKNAALEYLATLIEAIPDIEHPENIAERVLERERAFNTGIGHGWGCPHVRTKSDGELVCAVGWSPKGIDYGSPDGERVHIVVLYYVPETRKNAYLKEISILAKAIQKEDSLRDLSNLTSLAETRHRLLDAISAAVGSTEPEARARMIQLEARQTSAAPAAANPAWDGSQHLLPFSLLVLSGGKPVALSLETELTQALESREGLGTELLQNRQAQCPGFQVLLRSSTTYQPDRLLLEGIAIKINGKK